VRRAAPGSTAERELLAAERDAVLREAFGRLPGRCQDLIAMLTQDPPVPAAQISVMSGIPVGRIELSRGRCLDKLRRDPAAAALTNCGANAAGGDAPDRPPAHASAPQRGETRLSPRQNVVRVGFHSPAKLR
jgi:hypothetical protein